MYKSAHVMSASLDNLAPPRVMLIEADEAVGTALLRGLSRQGWLVTWAHTAAAGLSLKAEFQPHVVLLALGLPDMSSGILIACLTQQNTCGVVVLSGQGDQARSNTLAQGAHDYLAKPATLREVVEHIEALLPQFGAGGTSSILGVAANNQQAPHHARQEDLLERLVQHGCVGAESPGVQTTAGSPGDGQHRASRRKPLPIMAACNDMSLDAQ